MNELRDYQKEVIDKIQATWATCQQVMLQMPTGTGKTHVFCEIIKRHRSENKRILVLTHKRELVFQTALKITKELGIPPGIILANEDQSPNHQVQVATVQTLIRRKERINFLNRVSLIVVDEAHHAPSETYRKLISYYQSEGTHLLGVTATPRRSDGQGFSDIFKSLVQSWQIKRFISEGYLADVEHRKTATYYDVKSELDLDKVQIDPKTHDYDETQLGKLMSADRNMADAVESYIRYKGNFTKSIVFAVNVAHSKALTERFLKRGIRAAHIDGTTDFKTRTNTINDFRNGTISVLCNVGIITEGFDCPDAEIVQLVRPTKSITLYLQQVGRVMRPKSNGSHALILDSANCYDEFGSVKANRRWRLDSEEGNGWPDRSNDEESVFEPEAPEEKILPMVKVDEPSIGPLTKEWFDNLHNDYKTYFHSRFSHLDLNDNKTILAAIWATKEWNLHGLPIDSISPLRDLINIISLSISSTNCASLRPIMTLKRLTSLYISNTPVEVLRLPDEKLSLKQLNISRTKIKDMSMICDYPLIERLFMNDLDLNAKSYNSISALSNLHRFAAKNSNFSSLSALHNSKDKLEVLELSKSKLSSIATIHHFQSLKYLDISGTSITTLDKLRQCRSLETVVIKDLNIPSEELRELGNRQPNIWIED